MNLGGGTWPGRGRLTNHEIKNGWKFSNGGKTPFKETSDGELTGKTKENQALSI